MATTRNMLRDQAVLEDSAAKSTFHESIVLGYMHQRNFIICLLSGRDFEQESRRNMLTTLVGCREKVALKSLNFLVHQRDPFEIQKSKFEGD